METINEMANEKLQVLDPNLPFLASEAAIELDGLLLGRKTELNSVLNLASQLRNTFKTSSDGLTTRSFMDPAIISVLGGAFNNSGAHRVTSLRDLLTEAISLADELVATKETMSNRDNIEWLRAFCVSLSRLTSAYHKSIFDLKPQHPFKR